RQQATPSTEDIVVNPQFQGEQLEAKADLSEASQRPELLAAAPLDPSVYVSSPAPATGQVVSPEMPILPSADEYLPDAPDYFNGYIWPTRGTLTSGYGWRWGRMHRGIDVAGPVGTPIVSAAAGVVERAGWNSGGYGNLVEVRHADGSMTRYAHNSRILVRSGQRVAQGQHIADMGSTGYSTGPHLHFEVHLPDRGTVNPMAMLPGR
ncbi:MAG: M23 family metallopeptidase, partial [Cyanobacteria bacterium P01_F01_bin.116]